MDAKRLRTIAGLGAVLFGIGLFINPESALLAYLAAYGAVLFTVLGALFFVLLHHVVDAGWSTVVRRWAELLLELLPSLAVGAVILIVGAGHIYHWTHYPIDDLLEIKRPWLNMPFFIVRLVIYFGVWIAIARYFVSQSIRQDTTGDPTITIKLRKWAAPALLVYGLTVTFAAFDLLMTPDYHWFSTIFGVYIWGQGVVSFFALMALLAFRYRDTGLAEKVPTETVRSIGLFLFGFACFWGYLAASQWLLIWYANITEETYWMNIRWENGWQYLGSAAVAGLFVVPFVFLMQGENKRKPILRSVALAVLAGNWIGMLWVVMPAAGHGSWLASLLAVPGSLLLVVWIAALNAQRAFAGASPYPKQDPRLPEAVAAEGAH
ncbi:MAG: quinol:cytochrome C oxidoreductase [Planctomycetota bacterium]